MSSTDPGPCGSSSGTPCPDYPNSRYDLQRGSAKTPGLDVRLLFKDSKVRAHKIFLLDTSSEFWIQKLRNSGPGLVCIDMTNVDTTTPEAVDQVISLIYGKPFEQLGITTGENIQSFINALVYFQMDQMLEQLLVQQQKLFKMSEFWKLENSYIYNLCLPYLDKKTMEDAFFGWILLDLPNRQQYFDKFCDLKQIQLEQNLMDLNVLMEIRNERIEKLEEKVKQLDEALELETTKSTDLNAKILELETTNGEISKELEDLKLKFRAWVWVLAGQLRENIIEKN